MQLGSKKNRPLGGVAARCLVSFGNLTRQWIALIPALGVAICLGLATDVDAQGLGRPDLLDTANLPAGDDAPPEPGATRARYIRINSQVLAAPDSPLRQPSPAELQLDSSRLRLSLFTDTVITAALEKTLYRNDNNYVASGVIDDWPGSHVIVVVDGEVIAASLTVPGLGTYQIRYDTNGFHKVLEIDPQQLPGCNLVKKAPKKPRPIKLSKKKNIPPIKNGSEPGNFAEPPMMFSAAGAFSRDVFAAQFPEPDASSNTNVDVMVVYTEAAKNGAGGLTAMNTLIDLAVAEANEAYADSLIPVTLNLVYRGEVTYTESGNAATDLTRLQNPSDGHMDAVHATRNQFGADIVCLLTETMQSTYAGLGYLMTTASTNFSSYAFNVVRRTYAVGNYTFAHELGHNMGCAHDRQNSSTPGVFNYSYGHRFVGTDNQTYRTVMAYSPGTRIGHFSNPNVTYQGTATGVAAGATNSADNAASISNAVPYVSAFRAPVVVFSFTATSNTVAESTNTVTIDVRRSGPTNASVNIDYTMVEGTAADGVDFNSLNGTLTFSAGQTNKTIALELLDDDTRESVETLTIRLSNPGSGTMLTSNLTVYITDNDASYVQFASTGFTVAEGTNSVNLEVQRTGVTNTAVTVGYYTVNSTATAGTDYLSTNGLVSFSAGETSKTFAVTVFNDAAAEASEALFVRLRYPTNTVLGTPTNFTLTILTNDRSVIAFSAATTSTSESNSTVEVTLSRTGTTFNNASIDFATTNVTATAGSDYTSTNGTVTFTNSQTTATITLLVANDATLEPSETFRVRLYNPVDATLGTIRTNTVTITDDDSSFVSFDASTNLVYETNDTVTFTVLRSGVTNTAVSVNYTTTNGTATAGNDYFASSGILTFAAGVVSNGFTVSLTNDLTQESLETFQVRLLSPTNTAVALGTNLVTITDNDAATLAFLHGSTNVAEGVGTLGVTVVRSGATNTAVSVRFYSTNGTAGATDYFTTNGVLSFAANEVSKSFDLRVIDDAVAENAETVFLRLVSPTNATLSGFATNVVTINTNDSAYVSWSVASVSTNESTNALTLTVNRTGTTFNDVSVNFATTNVTAAAGADYYSTNGTLTLTNGQASATIALRLINDDLQESTETLQVRLSGVSDGIITNGTNTITLTDDDVSTLAFATNAVSTGESNVTLTVIVERSGATNTAVAVNFTTTNGTATAGADFTATSGTLSFVPGVVSNSFTVDVLHDLAQETNETFQLRLSSATNSTLALGTNTVTITDNDAATLAFLHGSTNVAEGVGTLGVTVVRSGATNTAVSVRFYSTNGTAGATDYFTTNGVLSFAANEVSKSFDLRVIDDAVAENAETVFLRLVSPTNATLSGFATNVVTINTNDSAYVSWSVASVSTNESTNALTLTVNRTGTTFNDVSVNFATTNVTALAGADYYSTNGTLTLTNGQASATIALRLINDDLQESTETLQVRLSGVSDGIITNGTNTITITDDDVSTLAFATNAVSTGESNVTLTVIVERSGATNTAVAVNFTTTNGTATAGADFTATSGTLSFVPGVVSNSFTVDVLHDLAQETNETFQLRLSSATNSTLALGTNTVTITDNDAATLAFLHGSTNVAEGVGTLGVTVVRSGATNTAVSVRFYSTNGTAGATDYFTTNGILSFAANEVSKSFDLRVIDDAVAENAETVFLRLVSPTNATLSGFATNVVTINTNDSAYVSWSVASVSTNESTNALTLTVNRTGTTFNDVSVNFATTNVTALAGADYYSTNGTLTLTNGQASATIALRLINDDLQESTETLQVRLSGVSDGIITNGTNTITLTDDDVSTLAFATNAVSTGESNVTLTVIVERSGATNTAVAVNFTTTNGTATAGADFTATSGTLSFVPGVVSNSFTVDVLHDLAQETNETFQLRLSSATNSTLALGTNTVTITDNDAATLAFLHGSTNVAEGVGTLGVTVVRSGATNTAVSVRFYSTNGTAGATDYFTTNGVLSFAANEVSKSFDLRVIDDAVAENAETVFLRLVSPTNATLSGFATNVVTINTNDSAYVSWSVASVSTNESTNALTLTVNRTGTTFNDVSVNFATTNVTAAAGADYYSTNGTLTLTNGQASATIALRLINDDLQESTETLQVRLSGVSDGIITNGTNTITLTDDDVSTLAFATNAVSTGESNVTLTVIVERSGATNTAVAVNFTTTNGTATAGADFTATSGTLSFVPGVVSNSFTVDVLHDLAQETNETFQLRLSSATNSTLALGTNTVTITDNDAATLAFLHGSTNVAEGVGTLGVTVVRSGATNTAVSVRFYSTNGTAGATDYFTTNGVLSFAANEVSKSFDLRVIDDAVAENAETVFLRLVSPTNATLSGFATNVVTINTNDSAYVSWSVASVSTNESTNALTLTVNRTGTTFNDVSVNFATTNVTAAAGADYYSTNGTLTLTNGQASATIALRLINDDLQESTETLQVRLSGVSDGIITNGTNTITLTDDDVSTLAFATNAVSTGESNVTLTVIVERSGATNTAVAVNFTTTNGTATAGADFTATSGTLSFVPGVVSNSFTVDVLHDLAQETNETFQLRLSSATNSTLALGTNTVTITDNDAATLAFLHGSTNVAEGVGTLGVTVVRSGATNTAVSVRFYSTNGTAGATDYFTTNGVLSFAANEVSKSFDLRVIDDAVAENAETVFLRLVSPTNATLSGFATNVVTINTNDSAYVSWSVASVSTNESTNALTLTVNRTGTTFNDVSVNFATTNVTAAAGADYYSTNGTLTLTNGQASATIALRLINDDLQESTETLQVRLSGVSDGIITNGTNTITLTDDDVSTLAFATNAVSTGESNVTLTVIVERSGATNTAVAVNFTTTNGTATAGADFTATSGTLSFVPGVVSNSFTVDVLHDLAQETNETFQLRLSSATNSTLALGTNTVTITDNDAATLAFLHGSTNVAEGVGTLGVTVVRSGATNTAVSVRFYSTNGTAGATDYFTTNGVLSFAANEVSKSFDLRVIDDAVAENAETVFLRLVSPTNATLSGFATNVVTINTNDSAYVSWSVASVSTNESTNALTLTVNRTGTTFNDVSVNFATTNVTAAAGADYYSTNGTLTLTNGQASATIALRLINDDLQESTETLQVRLSGVSDGIITNGTNTITLTDDDVSTLAFATNAVSTGESNVTLTVIVERSGATNTAVAVNFTTTNGTATAGADFTATSGTLSFVPGVVSNSFTVDVLHDLAQETNETFQLRLSSATNSTLALGTNTVTITDNDAATLAFLHGSTNVAEGVGTLGVTVVRSGATNTAVSVRFYSTNGTAGATDYFTTNGVLSFAANEVSKSFDLRVIDDAVAENAETVFLRLVSPTNATLSGFATNVVTINTNDSAYVSWSVASVSTNESTNALTLTVNRTGTTFNDVSVNFATTNVTAAAGADYYSTNGTLTLTNGQASATIALRLINDDLQESTETLQVRLSGVSDGIITNGTNTITLTDDDVSTLAFATNAVSTGESNVTLTVIVERSGATNTAVAVNFTTTNGTATAGADFTATSGTLSFVPGVVSNSFTVDVLHDLAQETNETFQLRLSSATNSTLALGTNTVTITDNDAATLAFLHGSTNVAEGVGTLGVTVVRSGATNTAVSVRFYSTNGTAGATDYFTTNGVLSFAANEVSKSFDLRVIDDAVAENAETVFLRLVSPTNATLSGFATNVVTINTNDSAYVSWSVASVSTNESTNALTLTVNRTGTTFNDVSVNFATTNVTAAAGADYYSTNGTLTLTNGQASATIALRLINDDLQESTETLQVRLSGVSDGIITNGTNTITLTDDDVSTLAFATNAVSTGESNVTLTVIVERSGATNTAVAVNFTTTNGTATAGADFTATSGTLSFVPGVVSNSFTVDVLHDLAQETNETFQLRLSSATNSTLALGTNTVTITDNDAASIAFTTNAVLVAEDVGTVTLTAVRSGATNTTVSVNFTNFATTATAGSDFTVTNGLMVFAPGVTTNTFTVTIANDLTAENSETISYKLQNPTNCTLSGYATNIITINTNDSTVLTWSITATNVIESSNSLTLTVNRTGTLFNTATVDFTTTNVTATAGTDYTGTNGTLTFTNGVTSLDITLLVTSDNLQEANETLRVVLSNPVDATITSRTNTVTITDDDQSTLTLTTNAVAVAETNTTLLIIVERSGATNTAVAVDYTTTNVTATAGSDYTATNGTLSFAPGVVSNSFTVTMSPDLTYEANETFRIILSGITNSTLSIGTNTVTITDDDLAYLGFTVDSDTANELDGTISVIVARTGVTNTTVSASFTTTNGSALSSSDYTATNGVVSFAPGETNKTITISITFDNDLESSEIFRLRLVSITNAASSTYTNIPITIADSFGGIAGAGLIEEPVEIKSIQRFGEDFLRIHVTGPKGTPFTIESSPDLKSWTPATSNVLPLGGFDWIVPLDRTVPARYFRVVPPQ